MVGPFIVYFNLGSLRKSDSDLHTKTSSNYQATYSCQEGFMLSQGDYTRTCGILGDWRGKQPLCKCNCSINLS